MTIEKKELYKIITFNQNSFSDIYKEFSLQIQAFAEDNIVLKAYNVSEINKEESLLLINIAKLKIKNFKSFVLLSNKILVDDFPEYINIVPTIEEAEDIINMEEIERNLKKLN